MRLHDPRSAQRLEQLAELRRRDPEHKIFGAATHRYQSQPVDLVEFARVQAAMGHPLPVEYRNFLLDVGFGAGPYHGLWRPLAGLEEFQGWVRNYTTPDGAPIPLSAGFPVTPHDLAVIEATWAAGQRPLVEHPWPCGGCLPVCHQGSTYWSVLVLAGDFAGRVWDLACHTGFTGSWLPAVRPTGRWEPAEQVALPPLPRPPTFGEWFDGWLEQALADSPAAPTGSFWSWPWSAKA